MTTPRYIPVFVDVEGRSVFVGYRREDAPDEREPRGFFQRVGQGIISAGEWIGDAAESVWDFVGDHPELSGALIGLAISGPAGAYVGWRAGQEANAGGSPGEIALAALRAQGEVAAVAAVLATGGGASPAVIGGLSATAAVAQTAASLAENGELTAQDAARVGVVTETALATPGVTEWLNQAATESGFDANAAMQTAGAMSDLYASLESEAAQQPQPQPQPRPRPQPRQPQQSAAGGTTYPPGAFTF